MRTDRLHRDGIDLTAAKIGGKVTGDLDATGCDIGVYYGPGTKGSVKKATIENAKYFGVVNFRGKVDVKDSTISQIGNISLRRQPARRGDPLHDRAGPRRG